MSNKNVNWSDEKWKEMIIKQRVFLWSEDAIEAYSKWLGLRQGMRVADIGCGLGYLGYTYWKYFGNNGHYIGIDINEDLLKDAKATSPNWAIGGTAEFIQGDVYKIPLPDNSVDMVMCQTLLMHLKNPEHALAEMKRILKPGGILMCKEPDNISGMTSRRDSSSEDRSIEYEVLSFKLTLIAYKGSISLGRGDTSIGIRVPKMLSDLGFKSIDMRANENVHLLLPPYETKKQRYSFEQLKERINKNEETKEKERQFWKERFKEEYLAGGGALEELQQFEKMVEEEREKNEAILKDQVKKRIYHSCGGNLFFIIKGIKNFD
ncbi:MAG: hypothetical protein A2381_13280 [Bdellovibrionales bacterium RIFOXYB1_FULL_37_110]|nr:MAG: hypothetical protein A2181_02605 [Bdellovibrionales bacterium RIFOXYA1_FULL_38_20]OFZ51675.1 MAG: hypothetical protein A2417_12940 [Bdellovibrionales bacterium RIFOXYC1_FULL_37_79]OFZ60502.1 MAG: hypothetical protein A2381_13280 [Bdellovibrionales bacterium RIFOXYB1_FULL_37_110]OFZ65076.1 MAG: hypothetical protein A2577_09545 [Bdellovibrionales bacterium RIFOXYD1_FULL_36_51]